MCVCVCYLHKTMCVVKRLVYSMWCTTLCILATQYTIIFKFKSTQKMHLKIVLAAQKRSNSHIFHTLTHIDRDRHPYHAVHVHTLHCTSVSVYCTVCICTTNHQRWHFTIYKWMKVLRHNIVAGFRSVSVLFLFLFLFSAIHFNLYIRIILRVRVQSRKNTNLRIFFWIRLIGCCSSWWMHISKEKNLPR